MTYRIEKLVWEYGFKNEPKFGKYRTKRIILEMYDAMQRAIDSGEPYQTRLDPPPAVPRMAHPPRPEESMGLVHRTRRVDRLK